MAKTGSGRKLGRRTGFRNQLLRSLTTDLIRHEQLQTTLAKARECSRMTNHLISVAKKDNLNARRYLAKDIQNQEALKKVFDVLIQRYASRPGGYTRIFKLQRRQGDNAEMALIKLIA